MRKFIYVIIAFAIAAAGCGIIDDTKTKGDVKVGDTLPNFAVRLSDGSTVTNADLMGEINVIVFFTVTCPDCQATLPELQKIYDTYSSRVNMLLISRSEGPDVVGPYWKKNGFTMPYSAQEDRSVYEIFAKTIIPRVYICSRDNIVKFIHTDSPNPTFDEMSEEIRTIL